MKVKDLEFTKTTQGDTDTLHSCKGEFGRITILDRETGWGFNERDIETGFKDTKNKFWLVSGMFDIRDYPELAVNEAISIIKERANTCMGIQRGE